MFNKIIKRDFTSEKSPYLSKFEHLFWPYHKKLFEIEKKSVILKKLIKIMMLKQIEIKTIINRHNA